MIDTHCHLNFRAFKDEAPAAVARAQAAGVSSILNVGSQWDTSERAVAMAEGDHRLFAAIGLHPIHLYQQEVDEEETHFVTRAEEFDPVRYHELARRSKRVVAVGECGLDYYRLPPGADPAEVKRRQAELFNAQIDLATDLNLPLIIHCRSGQTERTSPQHEAGREAYDDLFTILQRAVTAGKLPKRGVNHCFLGTLEQARQFLDLGFYISFTGIITFKNAAPELLAVVREAPLNKILTETDAPYLAPHPHRGQRNEPAYVVETAKKIAELKRLSLEEVSMATSHNAQALFGLNQ